MLQIILYLSWVVNIMGGMAPLKELLFYWGLSQRKFRTVFKVKLPFVSLHGYISLCFITNDFSWYKILQIIVISTQ